jgi:CelD/BcsL family acetyltransferase involved in cellulose biosynthesis
MITNVPYGFNLKKIEFIGRPDSDYHEFLISSDEKKIVKLYFDHLINSNYKWFVLELKNVPEFSTSTNFLRFMVNANPNFQERKATQCPFLLLPNSYDEFYLNLKGKFRSNIRNRENKLKKIGSVDYRTYKDFPSLDTALKVFFELNRKRFRAKGIKGYFEDGSRKNFHIEIAKIFAAKGYLHLGFLVVNEKPVAADYSFKYKQKLYAFLSGFDPEYSKYGVGRISELYHIKSAIEEGINEYDWMRGFEPYIREWTASSKNNLEFRYIRNILLGTCYYIVRDKIRSRK